MIYYENVNSHFGGMRKVTELKKRMGAHIFVVSKKYFCGVKYSEKTEMRKANVLDGITDMLHGVSPNEEVVSCIKREL